MVSIIEILLIDIYLLFGICCLVFNHNLSVNSDSIQNILTLKIKKIYF